MKERIDTLKATRIGRAVWGLFVLAVIGSKAKELVGLVSPAREEHEELAERVGDLEEGLCQLRAEVYQYRIEQLGVEVPTRAEAPAEEEAT